MGKKPVLIIHPGALGDVVLSFFAAERLSRRFAAVHLLCQEQIGKAAVQLQVVDRSFALESSLFAGLYGGSSGRLRSWIGAYDPILVLSGSAEPASRIRLWSKGTVLRIRPRPAAGAPVHAARHLLKRLAQTGLIASLPFDHHKDFRPPGTDLKRIIIHPGAGSPKKRWPLERFLKLAGCLADAGLDPHFFIGPAETDLRESVGKSRWPFHAADRLSDLLSLLLSSGAFVGNDSGVSHLAAYVGLPTTAVFGPTDPVRWAPIGRAVAVAGPEGLACAPCIEGVNPVCRHQLCLEQVSVDRVLNAVFSTLG